MSDKRDRRVNDRLEKMSGLFEHSEKKEKPVASGTVPGATGFFANSVSVYCLLMFEL